jgi:HSP20 family protein
VHWRAGRQPDYHTQDFEEETMNILTRRPVALPVGALNMSRLSRALDEAFQGWPFATDFNGSTITSSWAPPCDVFESKDALKIVVELPGVKPEDVKLSLENQSLTIRSEKKQAAEEASERLHRYERLYGVFERSFSLPNTVDVERVDAAFENGVLTINLPKVERAKPREIPVKGRKQ